MTLILILTFIVTHVEGIAPQNSTRPTAISVRRNLFYRNHNHHQQKQHGISQGCPTFYGKGTQLYCGLGSRPALVKITVSGIPSKILCTLQLLCRQQLFLSLSILKLFHASCVSYIEFPKKVIFFFLPIL
jgi:hypothetical protein